MGEAVFWLLAAVVALAPLPLASNRPWSWSLLSLTVGLLLIVWALAGWRARRLVTLPARRTLPFAAGFAAVVVWGLLQAGGLTPGSWDHPAWARAAAALGHSPNGAIALMPDAAVDTVMRLAAYGGVFWLALFYGRSAQHAHRMVWLTVAAGVGYAVYGLVVHLGGFDSILWYDKWAYEFSLTSTFVNRNSYATYAGLGLIAALTLLFERLRLAAGEHLPLSSSIVHFLDSLDLAAWLLLAAVVLLASALVLSGSRGGTLATLVGVAVLILCFAARPGQHRRIWPLFAVLAVGIGALAFGFSGDPLLGRIADALAADQAPGGRAAVYALTLGQITQRPWLGIGLGGFPGMFYAERTADFGGTALTYLRAHNTYLELALELGLPALGLLLGLLAALLLRSVLGVFRRRRFQLYASCAVAATALVAVHSLVDFSLQMPAVAVTYAMLLGAGVAQSWRSRVRGSDGTAESSVGPQAPSGARPA